MDESVAVERSLATFAMEELRAIVGPDASEDHLVHLLEAHGNDVEQAANSFFDNPEPPPIEDMSRRAQVLAAAQLKGFDLGTADKKFLSDKEIVMAAVRVDGRNLSKAAESLKADKEVVLAAVRQH